MTLNIKCPNCGEDINLNPYKKAIRQWLMSEQGKSTMRRKTKKERSENARNAVNARWKKHKMGGQNSENPNPADKNPDQS